MAPWRPGPGGLRLAVRLTPRAGDDRIAGVIRLADGREALAVRVRAAPADGAANDRLLRLIAEALTVPPGKVRLERGASSRHKEVFAAGDPEALAALAARRWPPST